MCRKTAVNNKNQLLYWCRIFYVAEWIHQLWNNCLTKGSDVPAKAPLHLSAAKAQYPADRHCHNHNIRPDNFFDLAGFALSCMTNIAG